MADGQAGARLIVIQLQSHHRQGCLLRYTACLFLRRSREICFSNRTKSLNPSLARTYRSVARKHKLYFGKAPHLEDTGGPTPPEANAHAKRLQPQTGVYRSPEVRLLALIRCAACQHHLDHELSPSLFIQMLESDSMRDLGVAFAATRPIHTFGRPLPYPVM